MGFVEVTIFTGDNDLRQWILCMEMKFLLDNFSDLQKLAFAQRFIKGKAESFVHWRQSIIPLESWDELKRNLLLRFGRSDDPERIKVSMASNQNLQKIIENLQSVRPWKEQRKSRNLQEAKSSCVTESVETKVTDVALVQNQVLVSSLEPNLRFCSKSVDVSAAWPFEVVRNNRVHLQSGFECVMNKNIAHQVFDELSLSRHRFKQRRKLSLYLKSWKFKFKHQLFVREKYKGVNSCSRVKDGFKWHEDDFRYWRRMRNTHMSRLLRNLRWRHDLREYGQLILDDLKSPMGHKWKSKRLEAVFHLRPNPSYALDVVYKPAVEHQDAEERFQFVQDFPRKLQVPTFPRKSSIHASHVGLLPTRSPIQFMALNGLDKNTNGISKGSAPDSIIPFELSRLNKHYISSCVSFHANTSVKRTMFQSVRMMRHHQDLQQFTLGDVKFHMKHKWRSKILHSTSRSAFRYKGATTAFPVGLLWFQVVNEKGVASIIVPSRYVRAYFSVYPLWNIKLQQGHGLRQLFKTRKLSKSWGIKFKIMVLWWEVASVLHHRLGIGNEVVIRLYTRQNVQVWDHLGLPANAGLLIYILENQIQVPSQHKYIDGPNKKQHLLLWIQVSKLEDKLVLNRGSNEGDTCPGNEILMIHHSLLVCLWTRPGLEIQEREVGYTKDVEFTLTWRGGDRFRIPMEDCYKLCVCDYMVQRVLEHSIERDSGPFKRQRKLGKNWWFKYKINTHMLAATICRPLVRWLDIIWVLLLLGCRGFEYSWKRKCDKTWWFKYKLRLSIEAVIWKQHQVVLLFLTDVEDSVILPIEILEALSRLQA